MTTEQQQADEGVRATIERVGHEVFGWDPLREGLADAVETVVTKCDVLAVMPTGYGKSAVYKIAGTVMDGVTVVVSPLIALQTDQVAGLNDREGAPAAVAINSGQSDAANREAWERIAAGEVEFVFLSPEQLADEGVLERLDAVRPSLFVVDEAHCVSSWGHDFRPDYLRLGDAVRRMGRPCILALTATGSGPVRDEIVERLGMTDPDIVVRGFDRPNISLDVVRHESDDAKVRAVIDSVVAMEEPGLLYVATRRDTEEYAARLAERGLRTAAYHAGLTAKVRREVHQRFRDDEFDVVVATSAFGMGIDKAGLRYVVHAAAPDALDEYYQEVGRCGRDGDPARAILHYRPEDLGLRKFFSARKADKAKLRRVVAALAAAGRPVALDELAHETDLKPRTVTNLVNLLGSGDAVTTDGGVALVEGLSEAEAVRAAVEAAESRQRIDESRISMIRAYAETRGCRRQFLLGYFGDEHAERCGNCDTCRGGSAEVTEERREAAAAAGGLGEGRFPIQAKVKHAAWGEGTVMDVEDDRITVFFDEEGYRVLGLDAVEERDLLERLG